MKLCVGLGRTWRSDREIDGWCGGWIGEWNFAPGHYDCVLDYEKQLHSLTISF